MIGKIPYALYQRYKDSHDFLNPPVFAVVGKRMLVRLIHMATAVFSQPSICWSLPSSKMFPRVKRKGLGHATCKHGESSPCACYVELHHSRGQVVAYLGWMGMMLGSGNSYFIVRHDKEGKYLA